MLGRCTGVFRKHGPGWTGSDCDQVVQSQAVQPCCGLHLLHGLPAWPAETAPGSDLALILLRCSG